MINTFDKSDNIRADDEKCRWYQSIWKKLYSLKQSGEGINDVMKFTSFLGYKNVIIEEIRVINADYNVTNH